MGNRFRRSPGTRAALAIVVASSALAALGPTSTAAAAGTQTNANACFMDVNGLYSTVDLTVGGTAVSGGPTSVGLGALSLSFTLPDAIYLELYSLGYYTVGPNFAGVTAEVTVAATNTTEQLQSVLATSSFGVDVSDPDGVRNTGDESVTTSPLITLSLPSTTWTPSGGQIEFSQAFATITTNHFFGSLLATLTCEPGTTPDRVTVVPAAPVPFEALTPPAPPSCTDTTVIGGLGITTDINLPALCADANGDIDPNSVVIVRDPLGGTASVGPAGVVSYTNADPNVGIDSFDATISDASGLVSAPFTISLVIQSVRNMKQDGSRIDLSPVTLDGDAQVAVGGLSTITVTNLPTGGLGFTVSAYATDLAAPEVPTVPVDLDGDGRPDVTIPLCTDPQVAARLCIPAQNMGWAPSATVLADVDGAPNAPEIQAGTPNAATAEDWRAALAGQPLAAGLSQPQTLCSAQPAVAAGVFECTADLFLGVPASAGATTYSGQIVITII